MYFADLQGFLAQLEDNGELDKVKVSVDPRLEIAAIVDLMCKRSGERRALRFENVKGSNVPVVANLFGSKRRAALALGVADVESLAQRLRADLKNWPEMNAAQALAKFTREKSPEALHSAVAPCFALDASVRGLEALPVLQSWPGDAGRYLTLGQTFTRHPDQGCQNCGMYRLQVLDKDTALIRFHPGSGGGMHMAAWHSRQMAMPVAVVLGGPPALTWSAGVPLPEQVSETEFTHYLTGHPTSVTECQASDLLVPSTAEIVIEGSILPGEEQVEGPFGNHTGYYSPRSPAPVLRVKSVHMRTNAVYPCTVVGPPPMENIYLAQVVERLMLPLLQHDYPWVVDVRMPIEGIYHGAALVSVDTEHSMEEVSEALWQSLLLKKSKLIVLLDKDCDLHESSNIYWRVINADSWSNSILMVGNKMVIDARRVSQNRVIHPDPGILVQVKKRWRELGLGTF